MSNRKTGTIKFFNHQRGFGFITRDDHEDDLFVHISNVPEGKGRDALKEGSRVSYTIGPGRKGPEAKRVRIEKTASKRPSRQRTPSKRSQTPYRLPHDSAPLVDQARGETQNLFVYLYTAVPFERDNGTLEAKKIDGSFSFDRFADDALNRVQDEYVDLVTRQPDAEVRRLDASIDWRLAIGLGRSTVYETGLTIHPIYGIPYIPGSGVKGALRTFLINYVYRNDDDGDGEAEQRALQDPGFCDLFGAPERFNGVPTAYDEARRGTVIFYDAFPADRPTVATDVMTSHFQDYYGSDATPPTDDMDPNPVHFLTVKDTTFTFLIGELDATPFSKGLLYGNTPEEQRSSRLATAEHWLRRMLEVHGLGAKTAVGYGYFIPHSRERR